MKSKKLKVISLYTGAGGLDLGLEAAGYEIAVSVEMDGPSCVTLRHNRPKLPVIENAVENVSSSEILDQGKLKKGEATLLVGGPPCQPFSKSSYWANGDTKRLKDPRSNTLGEYVRVLKDTLPEAFLLENVAGLVYKGKDEGFRLLLDLIAQVNREEGTHYRVHWKILNAAQYGVPQARERAFLIASRDGKDFQFPSSTHSNEAQDDSLFEQLDPYRTAWDSIGDLPPDGPKDEQLNIQGKWADLVPSIPEGENYLFHTERKDGVPIFGWRTRYWCFLLKLSKNLPSWTIQAQPGSAIGPFHWNSRRLSKRELMRLQTFPDDYEITASRVQAQKQLGNAVPSLLTEVLGRSIREQFFSSPLNGPLKLIPPFRGTAPKRERLKAVPKKFLDLQGDHAPHPGTGKGPRPFNEES